MIRAARRRKLVLQVGHIERFNPLIRAISEVAGPLRYVVSERLGPFRSLALDVGVVLDLMIHDLDLVLALADSPVSKVDVIGIPVFTSHEDIANVRLEFKNGCVANLSASRISRKGSRKIRLFKGESYISADLLKGKLVGWRRESGVGAKTKIGRMKLQVVKREPLSAELESFLECVRGASRPLVDGVAGRAALALACQIQTQIKRRLKV
jgi:predicted dehydrogenase